MSKVTPEMLIAAQKKSKLGTYICSNWAGAYDVITELYEVMDAARESEGGLIPNERGKNRYGLDMAYFRKLFNRELNRPLVDFRPDELARVLARAARTADDSVLREAEFQQSEFEGGEAVAYAIEKGGVAVNIGFDKDALKTVSARFFGDAGRVRPLVFAEATPQPGKRIPLSERLPTEADADDLKQVWFCRDPYSASGTPFGLNLHIFYAVAENSEKYLQYWPNAYWATTGLKRPNPPERESE